MKIFGGGCKVRYFGGFSNIVSRVDFFFNCVQQPFSLPLYQSRSLLKMKIDSSTCMTFSSLEIPLNKNDGMHICKDEW